jgi:hypothetical protein
VLSPLEVNQTNVEGSEELYILWLRLRNQLCFCDERLYRLFSNLWHSEAVHFCDFYPRIKLLLLMSVRCGCSVMYSQSFVHSASSDSRDLFTALSVVNHWPVERLEESLTAPDRSLRMSCNRVGRYVRQLRWCRSESAEACELSVSGIRVLGRCRTAHFINDLGRRFLGSWQFGHAPLADRQLFGMEAKSPLGIAADLAE